MNSNSSFCILFDAEKTYCDIFRQLFPKRTLDYEKQVYGIKYVMHSYQVYTITSIEHGMKAYQAYKNIFME